MVYQTKTPFMKEWFFWLRRQMRSIGRLNRPSLYEGMGASPYNNETVNGTTFRVWAPYASQVLVSGTFNQWSRQSHPLVAEGNGYWSADIEAARPGDEYKFIIHNGRQRLARTDPYALEVVGGSGSAVICTTDRHSQPLPPPWMPPWNEMVIYELHVGTFGLSNGHAVGTFQGVIDKLPYLQRLGINTIEIMPIAEFAGDYSWGYNPGYPFAITQTYGGRLAFRELVRAAHEHGIAVILDVVYNHFGPDDLSLWQFDGWQKDGKGGVFFYNDWRSTTPWADTRPDYGRQEVRQYIRDNTLMWLEEYQVDGLRWDATAWIRNVYGHEGDEGHDIPEGWDLMRWVNDEMDARRPWAISIAEDLRGNSWLTKETSHGGAGFDTQWDDRFVHAIRGAVIAADDAQRDMLAVAGAITTNFGGDVFDRVIYTESHDEVANGKARVPEEIAPGDAASEFSQKRSALGAALVFTAPGIPMIFQGQEFLEDGWFDDHDPLDWPKAEKHEGIFKRYQDLIRLRKNVDGLTRGLTGQNTNILAVDNDLKFIAFHRWEFGGAGDDVVVIANFAHLPIVEQEIPWPQPGLWQLRFNSAAPRYDPQSVSSSAVESVDSEADPAINAEPYAVLIYSLA